MAHLDSFEARNVELGMLLKNKKFKIPRNQRPYTWSEDQITDFWNDILENESQENGRGYFIGSFVLNYEDYDETGKIEVIDGQQRLLTTTILIAAIRDIAISINERELANWIQGNYIANVDARGNQSFKIECGLTTENFFKNFIQLMSAKTSFPLTNLTKEEKLILENYNSLLKRVTSLLLTSQNKKDKLADLLDTIEKVQVIEIKIKNDEEAYEIFETVNARGVDLSVADLLKNLIFKKVRPDSDGDKALKKWASMEEKIKQTENISLARFIRYYWLSRHKFITEKKLFKEIKKEMHGKDWYQFLEELTRNSDYLNKLMEGGREDFMDYKDGDKIFNSLQSIKEMDVIQCQVLFLSLLRNYDKIPNPKNLFELIEKFSFVYLFVCNLPANKLEKIYSKYAIEIEAESKNLNEKLRLKNLDRLYSNLASELQNLKPSYEEFMTKFMDLEYRNNEKRRKMIKYILSKIDQTNNRELKINFDNVNIEHILPQRPDKNWMLDRKEIRLYVNKLGNLTLVDKKINSKSGNKSIKEKLRFLSKSKIPLTRNAVKWIKNNKLKWSKDDIEKRQKDLARISYSKVWAL